MRTLTFTNENGRSVTIGGLNGEYILSSFQTMLDSRSQTVVTPEQDGQTTYNVWRGNRRVMINGYIRAESHRHMDDLKNTMRATFDPKLFGDLVFTNFTGQFYLRCRAPSLPSLISDGSSGLLHKFSVTLESDAPYFTNYPSKQVEAGATYLNHRFPLFLPREGAPFAISFVDAIAFNASDINIYPTIEIMDTKGATVHIVNDTTGAFLHILQPVAENQKMVVDTNRATAVLYESKNGKWEPIGSVLKWLSLDSQIKGFYLAPGGNIINVNEDLPTGKPITIIKYAIPAIGV